MEKELKNYLPYLRRCIGNIDECRRNDHKPSMFSQPKDERLSDFVSSVYSLDILNGNYKEYLEERKISIPNEIDKNFISLSLEDLCAVLTMYIRSDRFVEGSLIKLALNGNLYNTVKRIVELNEIRLNNKIKTI